MKRLKQLEQENNRLKKSVAERVLEIEVMKEIAVKSGERKDPSGEGPICDWSGRDSRTSLYAA